MRSVISSTALSAVLLSLGLSASAQQNAPAPSPVTGPPAISESALKQIRLVTEAKRNRTPAQRKIEPRLLVALRRAEGTLPAELKTLRTDVSKDMAGRVLVDLRGKASADLLKTLKSTGAEIVAVSPKSDHVLARVGLSWLEMLASRSDVRAIRTYTPPQLSTAGDFLTQGAGRHGSILMQTQHGAFGEGVSVGVVSDSVGSTGAVTTSQANGELPSNLYVLQDGTSGTDEGTAMLEILYDIAPLSLLSFSTMGTDAAAMASSIHDLVDFAGCSILVDDGISADESPFQFSAVDAAIDDVVANDNVLYFTAAGNKGNTTSGTSDVWIGDFVDSGTVPPNLLGGGKPHLFSATASDIFNTIRRAGSLTLWWSDAVGNAENDYDLFLLDSTGSNLIDFSNASQTPGNGDDPKESIAVDSVAVGDKVVVLQFSGEDRALALISGAPSPTGTYAGAFQYSTGGSMLGHSNNPNAITVGGVAAGSSYALFTNGSTSVDRYSTVGQRHVFYNADGSPVTPGNFLIGTGGGTTQTGKPDFLAADQVSTSVNAFQPFVGTSASAAHAAAITAQILSIQPYLSRTELLTLLANTAIPVSHPAAGAGAIMASNAIKGIVDFVSAANVKITPTQTSATITWTTVLPSDGKVTITPPTGSPIELTDDSFSTTHTLTVTGLTAATKYGVEIASQTESGSIYDTYVSTFITLSTAPVGSLLKLVSATKVPGSPKRTTYQVFLKNDSTDQILTNIQVTGLAIGSSASVTPVLPYKLENIAPQSTVSFVVEFPKQQSGRPINLRVNGVYRTATTTADAKFSGTLVVTP